MNERSRKKHRILTKVKIREIIFWTKLSVGRESKRKVVARYVNCKNGFETKHKLIAEELWAEKQTLSFLTSSKLSLFAELLWCITWPSWISVRSRAKKILLQYALSEPCFARKSYSWVSTSSALANKINSQVDEVYLEIITA